MFQKCYVTLLLCQFHVKWRFSHGNRAAFKDVVRAEYESGLENDESKIAIKC